MIVICEHCLTDQDTDDTVAQLNFATRQTRQLKNAQYAFYKMVINQAFEYEQKVFTFKLDL